MIRHLLGDARERLADLPDESVHCVVTSPPYWGLRSYQGDPGMIGLEPTFDEHLANLVAVFREVRRVLRKDGTLWLNYGDAYAANRGYQVTDGKHVGVGNTKGSTVPRGLKPKDLMMMPARVAMALQADGWWLRSEIIWAKPNPMPESVTDRPTSSHEKMFLLSRSARYFYDADAVRLPPTGRTDLTTFGAPPDRQDNDREYHKDGTVGANLRNVLTIPTFGFSAAHFATFPPKLVEPCIKAGTSEEGCCAECGAPWERVVERTFHRGSNSYPTPEKPGRDGNDQSSNRSRDVHMGGGAGYDVTTTGFRPTCDHEGEPVPCTVLDPFAGSGTTGLVADRLGRDAILIEISPEYADMAKERIREDGPLFYEESAE